MLTMKNKQDILWGLTELTSGELMMMKKTVCSVKADLNKKFYFTSETKLNKDTTAEKLSGSVLQRFLEVKRVGRDKSFIIFKNSDDNHERLKFIEDVMDVVMN